MNPEQFADRKNWYGSYYELGIKYAPGSDGQHLRNAIRALWHHPLLEGPLFGPYNDDQSALTPSAIPADPENMTPLYGLLHLPEQRTVGCFSLVMCPGTDPLDQIAPHSTCWVTLCIPAGMLELIYRVEYPIVVATNPWIEELERILVEIADSVSQIVPFDLGVVGEEATAFSDVEEPLTAERIDRGGYLISPKIVGQIKPNRLGQPTTSGLLWYPSRP